MIHIAEVIGWKFPDQQGMRTKGSVITEFPGGIPSQVDQDVWKAEYEARNKKGERIDRELLRSDSGKLIFKLFFKVINRVLVLEGGAPLTAKQFRNYIESELE